jgi:hypothetical protein
LPLVEPADQANLRLSQRAGHSTDSAGPVPNFQFNSGAACFERGHCWAARAVVVRAATSLTITAYCRVFLGASNACAACGLAARAAARSGGTVALRYDS